MKIENGILKRTVDSKKHYFVKHRAYSFDLNIMKKFKRKWHTLQIITTYGKVYSITSADFYKYAQLNTTYGKAQLLIKVKHLNLENQKLINIAVTPSIHTQLKKLAKENECRIVDIIDHQLKLAI